MTKIYAALAGLVALMAGFLALMFGARKAGRDEKQAEQMKETLDAVKDKVELDSELSNPGDRARLRDKHYRD